MLTAFTAGLLLITVSELGDKTFFIAALLSMRHSRRWVFAGSTIALVVMTVLSVLFGQIATLLPAIYVKVAEIALFTGFGFKLLYDARQMTTKSSEGCEIAADDIRDAEAAMPVKPTALAVMIEAFSLTFLAEWGDRTQIATMTLAAANNPFGVTLGAALGHTICAAIAVICGRMVCNKISERTVTLMGGVLFFVFAAVALAELLG